MFFTIYYIAHWKDFQGHTIGIYVGIMYFVYNICNII